MGDNVAKMVEAVAESGPLPSRRLKCGDRAESRRLRMYHVKRLDDTLDPLRFSSSKVGAWVEDQRTYAQGLASLHLINEGATGSLEGQRIKSAEVDQIRGVGNHGVDTGLGLETPILLDIPVREGAAPPLCAVLGKDLHRSASDAAGAMESLMDSSAD